MPRSTSLSPGPLSRLECDRSFCMRANTAFLGCTIRGEFAESGSTRFNAAQLVTCDTVAFRPTACECPFSRGLVITRQPAWCRGSPVAAQDSPADFPLPSPPHWANSRFSPPPWGRPRLLLRGGKEGLKGLQKRVGDRPQRRVQDPSPSLGFWDPTRPLPPPTPAPSLEPLPSGEFLSLPALIWGLFPGLTGSQPKAALLWTQDRWRQRQGRGVSRQRCKQYGDSYRHRSVRRETARAPATALLDVLTAAPLSHQPPA